MHLAWIRQPVPAEDRAVQQHVRPQALIRLLMGLGEVGGCEITVAILHPMHMQNPNLPYKEALEKFLSDALRQAGDPGASVRISDSGEFAIFSGEGDPKRRRLNEQGKQLMQTGSLAALADYDSLFEP